MFCTGGSKDMGRAVAHLLAAEGCKVAVVAGCTAPSVLERHVVPRCGPRHNDAGRAAPRIVVAVPIIVTDDIAHGRAAAGEQLGGCRDIPVYRAVLDQVASLVG